MDGTDIETVEVYPSGHCCTPFHNGKICRLDFHSGIHCTLTLPEGPPQDLKVFAPKRFFRGSTFWAEVYMDANSVFMCEIFDVTHMYGVKLNTVLCERLPQMIEALESVKCIHESPPVRIMAKKFRFPEPQTESLIFNLKEYSTHPMLYCPLKQIFL